MSKIIDLLQVMASDARFQDDARRSQLIEQADLTDELKDALQTSDITKIEHKLAVATRIKCIAVYPAEDEPSDVPAEEQPEQDQPESHLVING